MSLLDTATVGDHTGPVDPVLACRNLTVGYGGTPVLHGIDLQISAGSVTALLGANGSGKSTLVRALLGLTPSQGEITVLGVALSRFSQWRRIGYVPQRGQLALRNATVGEVVMSGRLGHRRPFLPASARDRRVVGECLERVGLTGRARDELIHLSGGQQQRALIARALAAEGDLLVMDEPLAGVDASHQQSIADLVGSLTRDGLTSLIVLHETGPLAPLIDREVVLAEGRIVSDGPCSDDHQHAGGHDHHEVDAQRSPETVDDPLRHGPHPGHDHDPRR